MKLISILVFLLSVSSLSAENATLQNQLTKRLQNCNCSAVMVDPGSGEILAAVNADPILKEKHPPGSLMKIFTLMAYAQTHGGKFPEFQCPRSLARDPLGCWDRNGHGTVNAQKAVAFSCNVYFRQLSAQTSDEAFIDVIKQFGIIDRSDESADSQILRKVMTGTTMDWRVPPMWMLRAYSSLFNGGNLWGEKSYVPSQEIRKLIRNGLLEGAMHGTSMLAKNEAGVEMLGKTGTSFLLVNGKTDYSHTQGWWIGLYPATDPKIAVMTFVRNGRGASDAAPNGGRALSAWLGLFNQSK
jgi:cell division protein FtsI/penicillin-binding protein 2